MSHRSTLVFMSDDTNNEQNQEERQQAAAAPTAIMCDKCAAPMETGKTFKNNGCVTAIGFALMVFGAIAIIVTTVIIFGVMKNSGKIRASVIKRSHHGLVTSMKNAGLPEYALNDLRDDGKIKEQTVRQLSPLDRAKLKRLATAYKQHLKVVQSKGKNVIKIGGFVAVLIYVFATASLILAFFLTQRRKIWFCPRCGYLFERI